MHTLEPYYRWRDKYIASEDERSPFFGNVYDEFGYSQKIYNYYIHPQWDSCGSSTLFLKVIFVDYDKSFAIIELLGEWNDCLHNDIMFLKREVIDLMIKEGITKYAMVCENVLNFHGSEDDYYEEWYQDIIEENGWICFLNLLDHVKDEMEQSRLHDYVYLGGHLNEINWRTLKPDTIPIVLEALFSMQIKEI